MNDEVFYWIEVDDDLEEACEEAGAVRIPALEAEKLVIKMVTPLEDGYHYKRKFGHHKISKIMYRVPSKEVLDSLIERQHGSYEKFLDWMESKVVDCEKPEFGKTNIIDGAKKAIYSFEDYVYNQCYDLLPYHLIERLCKNIDIVRTKLKEGHFPMMDAMVYNDAIFTGIQILLKIRPIPHST